MTVHLDHGATVGQVLTAIQAGFTSVMIDGSLLTFEDNIAITAKVVAAAHAVGLSVEGELGTIGKTDDEAEAGTDTIIYTKPEEAATFIERTGVDSLAIAIGTCHGIYPSWMKPELKLDLLEQIKAAVSIPLVLHGGSNNPDGEIGSPSSWASTRSTSPATSRCLPQQDAGGAGRHRCSRAQHHPATVHRRDEARPRPRRSIFSMPPVKPTSTESGGRSPGAGPPVLGLGGTVDYEVHWDGAVSRPSSTSMRSASTSWIRGPRSTVRDHC